MKIPAPPAKKLRQVHESSFWRDLFYAKAMAEDDMPWDDTYAITEEERALITKSIRQFQLGENAEGRGFHAAACVYAKASGDDVFPDALKLFIQEEQRHSRYLKRFMDAQSIPTIDEDWVDGTFRKLRRLAGLELYVIVLVSAEVIARPYYRSLKRATASPLLAAICNEILRDEAQHLAFQGNTLRKLRQGRTLLRALAVSAFQYTLMIGTCVVVWRQHGELLRCGGYHFAKFLRECLRGVQALNSLARVPLAEDRAPAPVLEEPTYPHTAAA